MKRIFDAITLKRRIDSALIVRKHKDRSARDVIAEIILVITKSMEHGSPLRDMLEKMAYAIATGKFLKAKIISQRALAFVMKNKTAVLLGVSATIASVATALKSRFNSAVNGVADRVFTEERMNRINETVTPRLRFFKEALSNFGAILNVLAALGF